MRAVTFLALMALMTVSLSGCLGFGDDDDPKEEEHDDDHDHCDPTDAGNYTPEDCPDMGDDGDGNGTDDPPAPNQLPEAVLTMTGPNGTLNATGHVLPGANVTFSAAGSSDPDGEVALVGLTITDTNGTRTAQLLDDGTFVDVTFRFDSVGPVNVTIRVLDDDGEGVIRVASFAVDAVIQATESFTLGAPTGSADACTPPGSQADSPLVTNNYAKPSKFSVQRGAQWIEARVVSGSAQIAICSPDGEKLSGAGTEVATEDDTNSTLPVNAQYYLMVLSKSNTGGDVALEIRVHYEPKA